MHIETTGRKLGDKGSRDWSSPSTSQGKARISHQNFREKPTLPASFQTCSSRTVKEYIPVLGHPVCDNWL